MFRRDTILHPEVFAEITSPRFPKTDDMAFGTATSMKLGTRKYFMPSYGMVRIHRQARTRALATREGRDADLFAYYKQALSEGFRPLLLRQKQQGLGEETLEHRLAQSLPRSEEHTSELQSLMRISYAVFCLKKKNKQRNRSMNKQ